MGEFIGQPQVLKAVNSAMIEQFIYERGPVSKPELARLTSLSLPTVNKLVADLESNGSIRMLGLSGKGTGRKAMLYETNKDACCLLVLYYHAEQYVGRVTDIAGKTLFEQTYHLDKTGAESALDSTISAIDHLLSHAPNQVKSIGIGVPGVVQPDGKLLGIPKIPDWNGFCLSDALLQRYAGMDISVENDVKLSTVGYYHNHLIDRYDNIVYIYAGSGVGAGIIINKKLYRGANNFSGELGFMAPLTGNKPNRDYTNEGGYLESQLTANTACSADVEYSGSTPEERQSQINILAAAAANHVAVLNPNAIVFGGEAFDEDLIQKIHEQMSFYTPKESMPPILYDDSQTSGIEGLIQTCRGNITTRMQLVQDCGV